MMLRPFSHASPTDYLKAVARELLPLFGAFAAMCGTRDPDGHVAVESGEWDAEAVDDFARWKLNDDGTRRAIALGLEAITMRQMIGDEWELYNLDPMVNQWYRPRGVLDAVAYILHWPEDDALATIEIHGRVFGLPRFGAEGEWLLALLLPSLRAGGRLLYSLGRQRAQLAAEMDALGLAVVVCDHDGRIVHRSAAVQAMLTTDPEAADVVQRIGVVARGVSRATTRAQGGNGSLPPSSVSQVLETRTGRYRLSGSLATHAMQFGDSDVLVSLASIKHLSSPTLDLEQRFALTPREREVAMLLANGSRNATIAEILGISPNTTRRHTERVLSKLGVSNRAGVAAMLHS